MRRLLLMAATAIGVYILYTVVRRDVARHRLTRDLGEAAFNPALTPEVAERIIEEIPTAAR